MVEDRSPQSLPRASLPPRLAALVARPSRLDFAIVVALVVFVLVLASGIDGGQSAGHAVAPSLDLVLDTVAMVVVAAAAALAWIRYRSSGEVIALYQASGFLALSVAEVAAVASGVTAQGAAPSALAVVGQHQLWVFTSARIVAAATLAVGGWRALSGRRPLNVGVDLFLPAAVSLVLAIASTAGLAPQLATAHITGDAVDIALTPLGVGAQLCGAVLTFVAAGQFRQLSRVNHSVSDSYLAFGLVLASMAQVHEALFPSLHPVDVAVADLLWLGFGVALLLGIESAATSTLRALAVANQRLEELRDVEVERAALEERTRLSRELHDGLAQDLWLAKLRLARLAVEPSLDAAARHLAGEAGDAVDRGLADARQAVSTLRDPATTVAPLPGALQALADEFSDRFGVTAEFDGATLPNYPPPRVAAQVVRIVQEALINAGRHADATLVRVELRHDETTIMVSVRDNGRGFDPEQAADGEYGLSNMRERAELIGGRLHIDARPLDGTSVRLEFPMGREAAGG